MLFISQVFLSLDEMEFKDVSDCWLQLCMVPPLFLSSLTQFQCSIFVWILGGKRDRTRVAYSSKSMHDFGAASTQLVLVHGQGIEKCSCKLQHE